MARFHQVADVMDHNATWESLPGEVRAERYEIRHHTEATLPSDARDGRSTTPSGELPSQ